MSNRDVSTSWIVQALCMLLLAGASGAAAESSSTTVQPKQPCTSCGDLKISVTRGAVGAAHTHAFTGESITEFMFTPMSVNVIVGDTVTWTNNGAFTHTEYRPSDNLLLVDLSGVSAASLANQAKDLAGKNPGVGSYRVVGYKTSSGANTTRVELNLDPAAVVHVAEAGHALQLTLTSSNTAPAPAALPR